MASTEPDLTHLLPELSGKEALLLARLLTRLADEIWRTYHVDISLVLHEDQGRRRAASLESYVIEDNEDLPF